MHYQRRIEAYDKERRPAYQVVFISGFADVIAGCVSRMQQRFQGFLPGVPFGGAYYHWDGGGRSLLWDRCDRIAADLNAARMRHPDLPFVLIGHSYGGSSAVEVARRQTADAMPLCLVTIAAVARVRKPIRPAAADWWGNSYLKEGGGWKDIVPRIGGRWGHCAAADVNLAFSGYAKDAGGRPYMHDRPEPMFRETPDAALPSLFDGVVRWLQARV